jgi:hypothetical protein
MQDPGRPKVEQDMSSAGFVPDFLCITGRTFSFRQGPSKKESEIPDMHGKGGLP